MWRLCVCPHSLTGREVLWPTLPRSPGCWTPLWWRTSPLRCPWSNQGKTLLLRKRVCFHFEFFDISLFLNWVKIPWKSNIHKKLFLLIEAEVWRFSINYWVNFNSSLFTPAARINHPFKNNTLHYRLIIGVYCNLFAAKLLSLLPPCWIKWQLIRL